jgi:hypothetical protein
MHPNIVRKYVIVQLPRGVIKYDINEGNRYEYTPLIL